MERALRVANGELVDISSLDRAARDGNEVAREGYACLGCAVPVRPCAVGPGHKVAPYFGTRGVSHAATCALGVVSAPVGEGSVGPRDAQQRDTTPRQYPTHFVDAGDGSLADAETDSDAHMPPDSSRNRTAPAPGSQPNTTRQTRLLARIVAAWLEMDESARESHPIAIPGVAATTYDRLVRFLPNLPTPFPLRPGRHVFAAPVFYSRPLWCTDTVCSIRLARGRRGDPKGHYLVTIPWGRWTQPARDHLTAEIETACALAQAARTETTRSLPWLFFLADSPAAGELIFRVTRPHHLVCYRTEL